MGDTITEYTIVPHGGHYDVFVNGYFYCSADTIQEAAEEIRELRESEE